jgi:hypothetical protein
VSARILGLAAVIGALALPAAAAAQTGRLAGRVDEATRAAVTAIIDSVRDAGVPADPLVNKALEGASKGADQARIVAAVRALAANLAGARAALGPAATEPELVAGAAALRAGAPPVFLEGLHGRFPREPLVVPLAVMADLVARGVPADTAEQAVLALVQAGVHEANLVAFRQSVERDIALGAPAGAAAAARAAGAGDFVTAGVPTTATQTQPPPQPRKP